MESVGELMKRLITPNDEGRDTHRGVGCLLLGLMGNGGVHVDQTQEIQTERRSQTAEKPGEGHAGSQQG